MVFNYTVQVEYSIVGSQGMYFSNTNESEKFLCYQAKITDFYNSSIEYKIIKLKMYYPKIVGNLLN